MLERYLRQVELVAHVLPHVATEDCFAIKGGTAINLFELNLPRLSVDIDLAYLPISGRDEAIAGINGALGQIATRLRKAGIGTRITGSAGLCSIRGISSTWRISTSLIRWRKSRKGSSCWHLGTTAPCTNCLDR